MQPRKLVSSGVVVKKNKTPQRFEFLSGFIMAELAAVVVLFGEVVGVVLFVTAVAKFRGVKIGSCVRRLFCPNVGPEGAVAVFALGTAVLAAKDIARIEVIKLGRLEVDHLEIFAFVVRVALLALGLVGVKAEPLVHSLLNFEVAIEAPVVIVLGSDRMADRAVADSLILLMRSCEWPRGDEVLEELGAG